MMTGIDLGQLKQEIVTPTLRAMGAVYASPAAINLLTGTALVESGCVYLRQLENGKAYGLWQMETVTHDDCWTNWLDYPANARVALAIKAMLPAGTPDRDHLVWNLRYACAMARIKYWRGVPPLPAAGDAAGLSAYHKKIYNSPLGAADAAANVALFTRAIAA